MSLLSLDEAQAVLEALFEAPLREALRRKPPHCYVPRADPHVVKPDLSRLAFDADRWRWLFGHEDPLATLQELLSKAPLGWRPADPSQWRAWFDSVMPRG